MNKLVFNTTKKTVEFYSEFIEEKFDKIPTVKCLDGYYEVMQEEGSGEDKKKYPVLRSPISATIMKIVK